MNETTRTFFFRSSGSGRGGRSLFFRSLSLDEFHPHPQTKPRPRRGYVRLCDQASPSQPRPSPSPSSSSSSDRYYSLTSSAASPASSATSSTTSCHDWVDGTGPGIQDGVVARGGEDEAARMCRLTADELVATEIVYVNDLRTVIEGYLIPVRARAISMGLMQVEVENLFGNVEQLYNFHESFRQKLEENRENFAGLSRCFSESKADLRRHYEYYVQNYPKALATLHDKCRYGERLRGGSSSSTTQLEALRLYVRSRQLYLQHSLPLSSYLLKPVQRILKYPLILKNLERHVIEAGVSREVLSAVRTALTDLSGVAGRINESRKVAENDEKLRNLVRGLLNWPGRGRDARGILKDLLHFGDLILEDELDCWITPTSGSSHIPYPLMSRGDRKRAKTRHVFLFQSAILIFKKVDAMTYTFKDMLPCRDVRVSDNLMSNALIDGYDANCCFALLKSTSRCTSVGQHFFKCSNRSQKSVWTISIRDLTNAYHHTTPPIETRYQCQATRFYLDSKIESSDKRLSLDSEQLAASRQGVIGAVDLASKALSSFQRLTTIRRSSTSITKMASHFYDSTNPSGEEEEQLRPLNPELSGLDLTPLNPYLLPPHAINFEDPPPRTITSLPSRWSQTSSGSSTYSSSSSGVHSGTSCANMWGCRELEK